MTNMKPTQKSVVPLPKSLKEKNKDLWQFEVSKELCAFLQDLIDKKGLTRRQICIYGLKRWLEEEKPAGYEKFLHESDNG